MLILNSSNKVYLGNEEVEAIYLGGSKIWPPPPPVDVGLIIDDFDAAHRDSQYACFVTPAYKLDTELREIDYGYYLLKSNVRSKTDLEVSVTTVVLSVTSSVSHDIVPTFAEKNIRSSNLISKQNIEIDNHLYYLKPDHDISFEILEKENSTLLQNKLVSVLFNNEVVPVSNLSPVFDFSFDKIELVTVEQPLERPVLHTYVTKTALTDGIKLYPSREHNVIAEEVDIPLSTYSKTKARVVDNAVRYKPIVTMSRLIDHDVVETDIDKELNVSVISAASSVFSSGYDRLPYLYPRQERSIELIQLPSLNGLNYPIVKNNVVLKDPPISIMVERRNHTTQVIINRG